MLKCLGFSDASSLYVPYLLGTYVNDIDSLASARIRKLAGDKTLRKD